MLTNRKTMMAQLTDQLYLYKVLICPSLGKRCLKIVLSTCSHRIRCQLLRIYSTASCHLLKGSRVGHIAFSIQGTEKGQGDDPKSDTWHTQRYTILKTPVETRGAFMMHSCISAFITAEKHHTRLVDREFSHAIIINTFECSDMPESLWH